MFYLMLGKYNIKSIYIIPDTYIKVYKKDQLFKLATSITFIVNFS